jgi:hypothetical protein
MICLPLLSSLVPRRPRPTSTTAAPHRPPLLDPLSDRYTFYALADDHVRLWIDRQLLVDTWDCVNPNQDSGTSGIDGGSTNNGHLGHPPLRVLEGDPTAPDAQNSIGVCDEHQAVVGLEKGKLHDIRVEYRELRGSASMRLMWSSPSTPRRVVPARNLLQVRHIAGSPFQECVIVSAPTSPNSTIAEGSGLVRTVAGVPAKFTIIPRDAQENRRGGAAGGDTYRITARLVGDSGEGEGSGGSSGVQGSAIWDPTTNTFPSEVVPLVSGRYELSVELATRSKPDINNLRSGGQAQVFDRVAGDDVHDGNKEGLRVQGRFRDAPQTGADGGSTSKKREVERSRT